MLYLFLLCFKFSFLYHILLLIWTLRRRFINSMGLSQKPSNALGACQWIIDLADKEEKKRKKKEGERKRARGKEKRKPNRTELSWTELKWATTFNAIARKIDDNSSVDNFTCHQWQWHKNANNFQLKQFPTIFQRLVEESTRAASSYGSSPTEEEAASQTVGRLPAWSAWLGWTNCLNHSTWISVADWQLASDLVLVCDPLEWSLSKLYVLQLLHQAQAQALLPLPPTSTRTDICDPVGSRCSTLRCSWASSGL